MHTISRSSQGTIWGVKEPRLAEFGALLNMLPQPALAWDRVHDRVLLANSLLLQMTAFSQTELYGQPIGTLLVDANPQTFSAGVEKSMSLKRLNREPVQVVVQANSLDVAGEWLLLNLAPEQKFNQSPLETQATLFIGLQELAKVSEEADLEHSLNKVIEVLESILDTDIINIYQAESDYPRLRKIASGEQTEIFPETVPSTDLIRLTTAHVWQPGKRLLSDLHRAGRIANLSYVATVPLGQEGALFGLLVIGAVEKAPGELLSNLLLIIGAFISSALQHYMLVDNLRRGNESLSRSLTNRNSLIENVEQGILVLFPDLRVAEINPAAELMLGYANWEVKDQFVENVLIGAEGLPAALEAARRGIPTHNLGNVSLHRRNGQLFPAHVQIIPIQAGEELLDVAVFITDISENEQIRIRTQQLEQRAFLGEFTAVFAHEVRNPINNIFVGLQVLNKKLGPDNPHSDSITRMLNDCTRLNHLMESTLSSARPLETKFEAVDIKLLLQRILDRWWPRFSSVKVKPFFQADDLLPKVMGDQRSLDQVFTNLISNAVEAMSKTGGTLAVHIKQADAITSRSMVEVTISDNGPGIPDDIRERIFEPFVSHNKKGTGLGLAITKRIVMAHRGSISVNSFPGGTVFHVHLLASDGE